MDDKVINQAHTPENLQKHIAILKLHHKDACADLNRANEIIDNYQCLLDLAEFAMGLQQKLVEDLWVENKRLKAIVSG